MMLIISRIFYLLLFRIAAGNHTSVWDPSWTRSEFIERTPASVLQKLAGKQRHLIFKAGPPASGKTDALKAALHELGLSEDPYMEINIDQFVMKNPAYREQTEFVKTALKKIVPKADTSVSRRLFSSWSRQKANIPSIIPPEISQLVCETDFLSYYKHRPEADKEAQTLIFNEFLETPHYRNMVYESTGSTGSYQFILKLARMARLHGFKVHIVYPLVRWTELIRRSELRALKVGRLVCPDRIRQIRHESRWNLRDIIRKLDHTDFPIDSVLIVNNDGAEGQMRKVCHYHKMPGRRKIHVPEIESIIKERNDL